MLPCQCMQMRPLSNEQSWCNPTPLKIRKPTRAHTHKQLLNKTHFHRCSSPLVSASETNLPHTLLPTSRDHQWLTSFSRPDQPMIHHTSQPSPSAARGAESVPSVCLAFLEYNVRLSSNVSSSSWLVRNSSWPNLWPRSADRNDVS